MDARRDPDRSGWWRRCRARSSGCSSRPATRSRPRQPVVVVEAMKMENELRAGRDGTVAEIHAREGMSVDAGALLDRRFSEAPQAPAPSARLLRYVSVCLSLVVALLAAAIVASVTVDLGPAVQGRGGDARARSTSSGRCASAADDPPADRQGARRGPDDRRPSRRAIGRSSPPSGSRSSLDWAAGDAPAARIH